MGEKLKKLFAPENRRKLLDLIYSVGAAGIFNLVIQLLVYPDFERVLGGDASGVALSIISLVAITAGTCGYAVNCARLLNVEKGYTQSSDYNLILLGMGIVGSIIGIVYIRGIENAEAFGYTSVIAILLYITLTFSTMLRYYSEVDFKISANFLKYMIFYIIISIGYAAGLFLFRATGQWMLALILGEVLSVLFVVIFGKLYRPPFFKPTKNFLPVLASIGFIFLSAFIDNITLHADRILLLAITGEGELVQIYYVASLIGKVISMLTLPINALMISYLVRYKGGLSPKLWFIAVCAATAFGAVGFGGCMLVSPILIKILYPEYISAVAPYLAPAILGQIFYFVSGMLMMALLRFKGEKKQLIFNGGYAVIFFGSVAVGTVIGDLTGFVWGIVIANAIRFIGAVIWGFVGKKRVSL